MPNTLLNWNSRTGWASWSNQITITTASLWKWRDVAGHVNLGGASHPQLVCSQHPRRPEIRIFSPHRVD
jgi:hypothetical protein